MTTVGQHFTSASHQALNRPTPSPNQVRKIPTSTPIISSPLFTRKSSLPTPFIYESASFSTKRDASSRYVELTPEPCRLRPKVQSISRCFKKSLFNGPKVVGGLDEASFLSTPGYSDKTRQTYFQQCFSINKVLGEGSFGRVYRCIDKASGVEYAVKVSEAYNIRSVDEAKKHEALSAHVNCVKFYKAWEERRSLHIQMELCDESLGHYIRRVGNRLPECEVWRVLQHSLSGLDHFHSHDLLHMDIKPDNIFRCCTKNTTVYKLGDFGLAVASNELNKTDIIEGDSKYIAPEILNGLCDQKADIFSVGITILEMIARVDLPNNGPMWHLLRQGNFPSTGGYSGALRDLVVIMMNPDPSLRPTAKVLLANPNHKYYGWLNFMKDKGSSVLNNFWYTWIKAEEDTTPSDTSEDLFQDMDEICDDIDIREPQLTPILNKKFSSAPQQSTNISAGRIHCTPQTTPQSPWPGSTFLSPVRSHRSTPNQSLLCLSNKFESSTPIKSFAFNESDLEELDEGHIFERPSLIKRNLLDSFDEYN